MTKHHFFPFRMAIVLKNASVKAPGDTSKAQSRCMSPTTQASSGYHSFAVAYLFGQFCRLQSYLLPVDPLSVAEGAWGNCLALESFIPSCHFELLLNVSEAIVQNSETPFLPEAKLEPVSWTVGPAGSRRD